MDRVRDFSASHIDEQLELSGHHENELIFNCTLCTLKDLTLKNCVLDRSKLLVESVRDALNFTVTLDCHSFRDVELSPLLFDLLCSLLIMTAGNDEKRAKLREVIGEKRVEAIQRVLKEIE